MAEIKKPKAKPGVFDVAKPGKTVPSSSAKPIIVTNRPILKDPMMAGGDSDAAESPPGQSPTPPSGKLKIEPLKTAADTVESKPERADTAAAPDDSAVQADEPSATDKPMPAGPVTRDEPATTTALDDETGKKKAAEIDEAALQKAAERQAELDKLAESRKYYLPINQVEKRRTKHYVIFGVIFIIILAVAWADVALDAGIITIPGVKAPTHFFK